MIPSFRYRLFKPSHDVSITSRQRPISLWQPYLPDHMQFFQRYLSYANSSLLSRLSQNLDSVLEQSPGAVPLVCTFVRKPTPLGNLTIFRFGRVNYKKTAARKNYENACRRQAPPQRHRQKTDNPCDFIQVHHPGKAPGVEGNAALTHNLEPGNYPYGGIKAPGDSIANFGGKDFPCGCFILPG